MTQHKKKHTGKIIIAGILIIAMILFIFAPYIFEAEENVVIGKSENAIVAEPQFSAEGTMVFIDVAQDTLVNVDIEIADNEREITQGMMFRSSMAYDKAMLFIMQYDREQSFWMRNTKMSLDIIYVNSNMEIVTIYKHTQPYSESPIPSFKRAKYVVETAAGFCDQFGIEEGDKISFSRL